MDDSPQKPARMMMNRLPINLHTAFNSGLFRQKEEGDELLRFRRFCFLIVVATEIISGNPDEKATMNYTIWLTIIWCFQTAEYRTRNI
jgi:hypothetical protein